MLKVWVFIIFKDVFLVFLEILLNFCFVLLCLFCLKRVFLIRKNKHFYYIINFFILDV